MKYNNKHKRKNRYGCFLLISVILLILFNFNIIHSERISNNDSNSVPTQKLKISGTFASLNLTNPSEVDNKRFLHNSEISIKGKLWNIISGTPFGGYDVAIEVDDVLFPKYNDTTKGDGTFQINYTISSTLNLYSSHKINVSITSALPVGEDVEYLTFYTIYVNITSYFQGVSADVSTPLLSGETLTVNGNLNYGDDTGIPLKIYNNYWYSNTGTFITSGGGLSTDGSGSLSNINVPNTPFSNITLMMNYSDSPQVNYSETLIPNIRVFQGITWTSISAPNGVQGATYTVTGQLSASNDFNLKINNREVRILYNGTLIAGSSAFTTITGNFTSTFTLPMAMGNGTHTIQVELVNFVGMDIKSLIYYITVNSPAATPTPPGFGGAPLPFAEFFMFFIPILIGVIAVLAAYGYYFLKKQKEEAQVVSIPLEDKIKNLKILKDTGRLEESLSYLFNAIFMELVSARYGREKKEFETIRDFAIVSVKELGLKATVVYPFMTKVESIIYNRPFKISDKDFYSTCDIFSPVYFELTGHNFILNF